MFAAIVWPARRVWAVRTVEVLVALILSKVAIVAVLALGGAALAHSGAGGLSRLLGGLALVVIGAFSPWVLFRLIPLTEVAAAAVGHVRGHLHQTVGVSTPEAALTRSAIGRLTGKGDNGHAARNGDSTTVAAGLAVQELLEQMHRRAQAAEPPDAGGDATPPPTARSGDRSPSAKQGQGPVPPPPASDSKRGATAAAAAAEPETIVQRPDGSWEPLAHADPDTPIPPPPWELTEHNPPPEADAGARPAGPPAPEPQDGPLGGGQERED
jgi:hypothetical protein